MGRGLEPTTDSPGAGLSREQDVQTVILCGGLGTRLREETEFRPKPMVEIAGRPILWHIMKYYAHYGYRDFILAVGYRGDMIRDYFLNYKVRNNDFTVDLETGAVDIHPRNGVAEPWRVTIVETGWETMTGSRLKQVGRYIRSDDFMLTYGDGLSDIPLPELVAFHRNHGRVGTVSGVLAPSRFGELTLDGNRVVAFSEKPRETSRFVCGGFFVFKKAFLEMLDDDPACVLEKEPLEQLAESGQLMVYLHEGYWHSMDTYRDYLHLNQAWKRGERPWAVWERGAPAKTVDTRSGRPTDA